MLIREEKEYLEKSKAFGTVCVSGLGNVQSVIDCWVEKLIFERKRCANLIAKKREIIRERDNLKVDLQITNEKIKEARSDAKNIALQLANPNTATGKFAYDIAIKAIERTLDNI